MESSVDFYDLLHEFKNMENKSDENNDDIDIGNITEKDSWESETLQFHLLNYSVDFR